MTEVQAALDQEGSAIPKSLENLSGAARLVCTGSPLEPVRGPWELARFVSELPSGSALGKAAQPDDLFAV